MKKRTGYEIEKEYLLLDNTGCDDIMIDIPEEYKEKGLINLTCKANNSPLKDFEFLEVFTYNPNGNWVNTKDSRITSNRYYVSIYKPEFIVDAIEQEVTQSEKEILYDYTSKHWNEIIDTFKKNYNSDYNRREIEDFNPDKHIDEIIWPDKSPDYRLLPNYKE